MSVEACKHHAENAASSCSNRLPAAAAILLWCLAASNALAEVKPVAVRIDESKAWIGQRVSFFVELRAAGSFAGSASFDLPQLPGVIVIKIGSPVVGSQQFEGQSWFVQTHEFALFSQRSGMLVVPEFSTRFSRRDDFAGPVNDVQTQCPSFSIEIERPPGSEGVPFMITTESMEVSETWDPMPGNAEVGALFKRTIVQRAEQLPGMAFAPISSDVPDGIRFYAGEATTHDQLERGDFIGERRETVSYLLQKPGSYELPELNFVWWNPKTQTLDSKTLPAIPFVVSAAPVANPRAALDRRGSLLWPLVGAVSVGAVIWLALTQRKRVRTRLQELWAFLNPPEQVAARHLQHACRSHEPTEAYAAWSRWSRLQGADFVPMPRLEAAVVKLQRSLFGPIRPERWNGDQLSDAFREQRSWKEPSRQDSDHAALPKLNPAS